MVDVLSERDTDDVCPKCAIRRNPLLSARPSLLSSGSIVLQGYPARMSPQRSPLVPPPKLSINKARPWCQSLAPCRSLAFSDKEGAQNCTQNSQGQPRDSIRCQFCRSKAEPNQEECKSSLINCKSWLMNFLEGSCAYIYIYCSCVCLFACLLACLFVCLLVCFVLF